MKKLLAILVALMFASGSAFGAAHMKGEEMKDGKKTEAKKGDKKSAKKSSKKKKNASEKEEAKK